MKKIPAGTTRMRAWRLPRALAAALEKAARLAARLPAHDPLPPLPEALVRAYRLDQRRYRRPTTTEK